MMIQLSPISTSSSIYTKGNILQLLPIFAFGDTSALGLISLAIILIYIRSKKRRSKELSRKDLKVISFLDASVIGIQKPTHFFYTLVHIIISI